MTTERTDRYHEKASKSRVLRGYKRKGKRFIPPLLQIANTEESAWLDDRLPELIWIALLNRMCGLSTGTSVATSLAKAAATFAPEEKGGFGAVSDYASLTEEEQALIRGALDSEGVLPKLRLSLAALIDHYPECPLTFLADPLGPHVSGSTLDHLKQAIADINDRTSREAILAQATFVYILLVNEKLRVAPGLGFENLDAVRDYPETDESHKIAALVRSTSLTLLNRETPSPWRTSFWHRGRQLEHCKASVQ